MGQSAAGADLSADGHYRYTLWRNGGTAGRLVTFIALNPSTADATADDPTVRKCRGFTELLQGEGFRIVNLFAYRATDPEGLLGAADPVGPLNDAVLRATVDTAGVLVCAWGATGSSAVRRLVRARLEALRPLLEPRELWCLGTTADGSPRHPLMLPYSAQPELWIPTIPW